MNTTYQQDLRRKVVQITADVSAWLSAHAEHLDVMTVTVARYRNPAPGADVNLHSNLADLPKVLALIPQATVTGHATVHGVRVDITFTTGQDSPVSLCVLLTGEEAEALAQTAGLAYPARAEQARITTDTLAAAGERDRG